MSSKQVYYLVVDETLKRLNDLKIKIGDGKTPFMTHGKMSRDLVPCSLQLARAGVANVYKGVSRGGVPVVITKRGVRGDPILTLDAVIEKFEVFKAEAGRGDIPFLAQTAEGQEFQLCDLWHQAAGAADIFRSVSSRGRPVVVVALTVPDKD